MTPLFVIISEQHSLLPEQQELLNDLAADRNAEVRMLKIPRDGISTKEQEKLASELVYDNDEAIIVFVSPIPVMLGKVAVHSTLSNLSRGSDDYFVYVFTNDKREKKELPNGKVISTIAKTGWILKNI